MATYKAQISSLRFFCLLPIWSGKHKTSPRCRILRNQRGHRRVQGVHQFEADLEQVWKASPYLQNRTSSFYERNDLAFCEFHELKIFLKLSSDSNSCLEVTLLYPQPLSQTRKENFFCEFMPKKGPSFNQFKNKYWLFLNRSFYFLVIESYYMEMKCLTYELQCFWTRN